MIVRSTICKKPSKEETRLRMGLTRVHNQLRSKECAANMYGLVWDEELANQAKEYAQKCIFKHASKDELNGAGENLVVSTKNIFPKSIVEKWYCSEKKKFSFGKITNENYKEVGHYTAVVWAKTRKLGCAWVNCTSIENFAHGQKKGYIGVCRYTPAGNIIGEEPYIKGKACTMCNLKQGEKCCDGLCFPKGAACREGNGHGKCEEPGPTACGGMPPPKEGQDEDQVPERASGVDGMTGNVRFLMVLVLVSLFMAMI